MISVIAGCPAQFIYIAALPLPEHSATGLIRNNFYSGINPLPGHSATGLYSFACAICDRTFKKNRGLCPYRPESTDLDFPRSLSPYRPQGSDLDALHSILNQCRPLHLPLLRPRWEPAVCWDSGPPKQRNIFDRTRVILGARQQSKQKREKRSIKIK